MKYITKPQPIEKDGISLTLEMFISFIVNSDDSFGKNAAGLRAAAAIDDVLASSQGTSIALQDEHWRLLSEAVEAPTQGYPVLFRTNADNSTDKIILGKLLLPFIDAIVNASSEA